jgi:hypothetical protein
MILMSKSNIRTKAQEKVIAEETNKIVEALSSISAQIRFSKNTLSNLSNVKNSIN